MSWTDKQLPGLQFAYPCEFDVEESSANTSRLDKAGCALEIMFFDFSIAFNTIQPALLHKKQVDSSIITLTTTRRSFLP